MKKIFEYILLFIVGGLIYILIELLWDSSTHWTMFVCGGIVLICVGLLNEIIPWSMTIQSQMLCGCILITVIELIIGLIFNRNYSIWDYRNMPYNYKGQICLSFCVVWFFVSGLAIVIDDWLRYFIFDEDKPHYIFYEEE